MIARPDDRAQLLIVAAIGLAILLTVLALALNTAVYGEVHVSQTDDSIHEERGAIQYQDAVRRGTAGFLPVRAENEAGYDDIEAAFREDAGRWNELARDGYARDGVATNASVTAVAFESWIVQDEVDTFENRSGEPGWTVAPDADDVDGFEMVLESDTLAPNNDCKSKEECFTLEVKGDSGNGDAWRMFVYTSPESSETVEIDVEPADGEKGSCVTGNGPVPVNVTGGSFEHEECDEEFTPFTDDEGIETPYVLRYEDAHNVTGTYELRVHGTVDEDHYYAHDSNSSPWLLPEIVAADVAVEYRSPDLTYRTELRIAPGEDDE